MNRQFLTTLLALATLAAAGVGHPAAAASATPADGARSTTYSTAAGPGATSDADVTAGDHDARFASDESSDDPPSDHRDGPRWRRGDGPQWQRDGGPQWQRGGPYGGRRPGRGADGAGMRRHRGAALAQRLNLSAEQRDRLRGIRDRQRRHAMQARTDLRMARMDLGRLMRDRDPDTRAIEAQIDRLARMRADLQKSRVESMLEAREVLTPEQQRQMREWRMGGAARMHGEGQGDARGNRRGFSRDGDRDGRPSYGRDGDHGDRSGDRGDRSGDGRDDDDRGGSER